jgi:dienelactone hydrolase
MTATRTRAPEGRLATYDRSSYDFDGVRHDVYRKGRGPAVIVLAEMPGISPHVLGFADRVVDIGCSVALPDLFGEAGRDPLVRDGATRAYAARTMVRACVSREFTVFATGRSSPIVSALRRLAREEHARAGGPGVGVVGMCFTGGFALAMATDPSVLAPVMSQPSLPFGVDRMRRAQIDCSADELDVVAGRCAREGLKVIGLRFRGDPLVPSARFEFLRERLGDSFVGVEIDQNDGHPAGPLPRHHSVLTSDLIDEPGEPTREALDKVIALFKEKLLVDREAARDGY